MTGAAPLQIVPLQDHSPSPASLHALASELSQYLCVPAVILAPVVAPRNAWSDQRLSSNMIVDWLVERFDVSDGFWTLALTEADLLAPGRDFVFGEATLGGAWAVVSSARLGDGQGSGDLLQERLFKESLHEIGHLAGLGHCTRRGCVMCRSSSVAAVDMKSKEFCENCVSAFFQSARS